MVLTRSTIDTRFYPSRLSADDLRHLEHVCGKVWPVAPRFATWLRDLLTEEIYRRESNREKEPLSHDFHAWTGEDLGGALRACCVGSYADTSRSGHLEEFWRTLLFAVSAAAQRRLEVTRDCH